MLNKNDLLTRLKNPDPWTKFAAVSLLAAIVLAVSGRRETEPTRGSQESVEETLSTYIPAGQRLVPIEILNSGALDSILGRYGFVDLYREGHKPPFARNVRIVKSIDGSGEWAALVSEDLADEIMSVGARFHVAVQPARGGQVTQGPTARRRRIIVYDRESSGREE